MLRSLIDSLLTTMSLGTLGFMFLLLGFFLLCFCRIYGGVLSGRDRYADNLRAEGENLRADKIDTESKLIKKRMPIYGKLFVALGMALIIGAAFIAWL
jgi:hypothetical protein